MELAKCREFSYPPACSGVNRNYALFWNSDNVIVSYGGGHNQFELKEMERGFNILSSKIIYNIENVERLTNYSLTNLKLVVKFSIECTIRGGSKFFHFLSEGG